MDFLSFVLSANVIPHSVAMACMVTLSLLEGVLLLSAGTTISEVLHIGDHGDGDVDAGHPPSAFLEFLKPGGLPLSMGLILALFGFGAVGWASQAMYGTPGDLPMVLSVPMGIVGSVFFLRYFGGALARVMPRDESSALSEAFLVGRDAIVTVGVSAHGNPAPARASDLHGRDVLIRVEPLPGFADIPSGGKCVLERFDRSRGVWFATSTPIETFSLPSPGDSETLSLPVSEAGRSRVPRDFEPPGR